MNVPTYYRSVSQEEELVDSLETLWNMWSLFEILWCLERWGKCGWRRRHKHRERERSLFLFIRTGNFHRKGTKQAARGQLLTLCTQFHWKPANTTLEISIDLPRWLLLQDPGQIQDCNTSGTPPSIKQTLHLRKYCPWGIMSCFH